MSSSIEYAGDLTPRSSDRVSFPLGTLVAPAYAVLCLASLLPFILVEHPPIVDFANHAARLFLACNASAPAIADMYQYRIGFIPNLAVDLLNLPLCGLMSPAAVLKAVTALSLLLIYGSGWLIQKKLFGRPNAFLFVLPAIALNLVTTMGYGNFLAGVAVAMLLIALAIGRESDFKTLLLICNVGGLVIFFCHIFALAFALMFFFGLQVDRGSRSAKGFVETGLRTAALFALPLVLALFVPGEGQGFSIDYFGKIRLIVAPFMTQHAGVGIFGVALLAPLYLLFRNKVVEVHPSLRMPLLAIAAYVALVPSGIQDAVDVDSRTLVALAYLFFAALRPVRDEARVTTGLAAISAGLVAIQFWTAIAIWQPFSREVAEFRDATSVLPRHAKILSVTEMDVGGASAYPLAYSHLASYATMDRLVFNPLEFTGIGMQPLSPTPKYASIDTPAALPFTPKVAEKLKNPTPEFSRRAAQRNAEFALRWPDHFEYVVYYHFGHGANFDPDSLTEVRRGSFFSILEIRKPLR